MSQVTSSDSQLNLATYIERFKRQLVALVMEVYRMRLNTWAIALPGNSKKNENCTASLKTLTSLHYCWARHALHGACDKTTTNFLSQVISLVR